MTIHQISVFLENKAGQLAEITGILAASNIDLRAINIAETADYGVLRLIVSDAHKAGAILLEQGFIPVVSTVGYDDNGNSYNINADTAAARIAGQLKCESLISMTDIAGILRDKDDPSTLIPKIYVSEAPQLIAEGVISGGMIPKIECCIEAIRRGVKKVFVIDGRIPHAILIETLTDEGIGTMFVTGDSYNDYQRN